MAPFGVRQALSFGQSSVHLPGTFFNKAIQREEAHCFIARGFIGGESHARGARRTSTSRWVPLLGWSKRDGSGARRMLERTQVGPIPGGPLPERFEEDNEAYADLAERIEAAATETRERLQGTSVFLVGMMGSGKTTIGKMLSQGLGYCYFDTDALIEQLADKTIPEIFAEEGEEEFRKLETQVLQELAPFKQCVVSTGGGIPTKSENWGHMQAGISVWLNGPASLLARRVFRDGVEGRPLLQRQDSNDTDKEEESSETMGGEDFYDEEYRSTLAKVSALLEDRKEQYGFADLVVSLEGEDAATADLGAPPAVVVLRVLLAINHRIVKDAEMREERKNFEVVNDNLPPSMRVVKSINPVGDESDPYLP